MIIRQAQAADNLRLLEFQAQRGMAGQLPLRFDRTPDYFALHRCHADDHRTWVAETTDGAFKGVASLVLRNGYLGGHIEPVAYLGDLRVVPDRRLSQSWMTEVRARLNQVSSETGVTHAWCCIIRDNRLASQSLLRRRRANSLELAHWHGYSNVTVYGQRGWGRPPNRFNNVRVVDAQPRHADALRAFLDRESAQQAFGCVFTEDEFSRRLQTWPDFGLGSFLLALDARDNLLGCVAPWDAGRIKRIVIERLPLSFQALRLAVNAVAPLVGRPQIAAPGGALEDVYLTHLQIRQRDPHVFAALLDAAWARVRGQYALMQLCLYDNDPLWSAMDRYRTLAVPMDLYTAQCGEGNSGLLPDIRGAVPGFEIYLV